MRMPCLLLSIKEERRLKIGVKKPIPKYIKKNMPCGITLLNVVDCRYYGIIGLSRKSGNWAIGMFSEHSMPDWFEAEYILDLQEGLWWRTGKGGKP